MKGYSVILIICNEQLAPPHCHHCVLSECLLFPLRFCLEALVCTIVAFCRGLMMAFFPKELVVEDDFFVVFQSNLKVDYSIRRDEIIEKLSELL